MKAGGGVGKRLLRSVLHRYVPRELVDRPKKGFTVPLDRWLRCELRGWAENLLDARRLEQEGILDQPRSADAGPSTLPANGTGRRRFGLF